MPPKTLFPARGETLRPPISPFISGAARSDLTGRLPLFPRLEQALTDQQSKLDRPAGQSRKQVAKEPDAAADSRQSGTSTAAVAAGLEFIFSIRQQAAWSLGSPDGESAAWVTAYVLARLGEIPSHHLSYPQRQKIEESLDWLLAARTSQGGWTFGPHGSPDDVDSTAWAVAALRHYGRPLPDAALELIQSGRRADGSFTAHPTAANKDDVFRSGAADVTAIAVRALASIDSASSEFLAARLRTDIERPQGRLASAFFVSSTLIDWEPGMAPWFVVDAVRQLVSQQEGEGAWEQALRLRCQMRLRMQSAWALAASLRRLQRPDGSWPGSARLARLAGGAEDQSASRPDEPCFDHQGVLATATAVSALAIGDLQPGLYFGSDLPFRRL